MKKLIRLEAEVNSKIDPISEQYQGVVLAHSGGLDSTALFHVFCDFAKRKKNFRFVIFHTNYCLRGKESDLDQSFSGDLAATHGIPFHTVKISDEERENRKGESVQEWARRLRYQAFQEFADKGWLIAIAHHSDDLAENVLLRLSRGSSVENLTGMKVYSPPYWRPMLHEKRADIAAYMKSRGLTHREDPSNAKLIYSRNVIRHKVLPELETLYPGATQRIISCANEAEDLVKYCREKLEDHIINDSYPLEFIKRLSDGVALQVISDTITRAGLYPRDMTRKFLRDILDRIKSGEKTLWSREIPSGGVVSVDQNGLRVSTKPVEKKASRQAQHDRNKHTLHLKAFLSSGSHTVLTTPEGDLCLSNGESAKPVEVELFLPASNQSIKFDRRKSWTHKELMQLWQVSPKQRHKFLVVKQNEVTVGIFDGTTICKPDKDGKKVDCEELSIKVSYETK